MLSSKVTLVLGAGSSLAFGYPLGTKLKQDLISIVRDPQLLQSVGLGKRLGELEEFADAFSGSRSPSVDAFLAAREDLDEIGKLAIATRLRTYETWNPKLEYRGNSHDPWIEHVFSAVLPPKVDDLDLDGLKVITFNYDRSFEWALVEAIRNRYHLSSNEACGIAEGLGITHVYGRLGSPFPGDDDHIPFGHPVDQDSVALAASNLFVIPNRRDQNALDTAKAQLLDSDSIVFLGFGFDPMNLRRLDTARTCARVVARQGASIMRRICGTVLDLQDAEYMRAIHQTAGHSYNEKNVNGVFFDNCNCTMLLRKTLVLGMD